MNLFFKNISINEFVKSTIQSNPDLNSQELTESLLHFKKMKDNGELCICGNPLWVAGSAIVGKGCFTCITGETDSSNDYEVE
ncbi:MAG: hypothetical protein K0B10_15625 [Vicingaceae bacterium]|nr:hypothetical protein [Vicingaceae bacterium]